jgi:hypothetical protein
MNRRSTWIVGLFVGMAIAMLLAMTGCEVGVYGGARASAFYPDNLMDKKMGDPRKSSFDMPQKPDGIQIGGNSASFRPGERPLPKGGE